MSVNAIPARSCRSHKASATHKPAEPNVRPLFGATLSPGQGLGGKAASLQRSIVVNDYVRAGQITHRYDDIIRAERLRAMIGAPVVVARQTIAVVYGAIRDTQTIGGR